MASITSEFPQISFDTQLMDNMDDLWFVRILTNDERREYILEKCGGDLMAAYDACIQEYLGGRKVEKLSDCFKRTCRLKEYIKN